jgi:hypothetical protein
LRRIAISSEATNQLLPLANVLNRRHDS